jgi:NitT/TauT family transport system ATP-binding protein
VVGAGNTCFVNAAFQCLRFTPGLALHLVPELEGISVAELADELVLELDDLLPILDAGELLELMAVDGARLGLTAVGRALAEASEEEQQRLLRSQLMLVPLVRRLQEALEASPKAEVEGDFVLDLLSEQFTQPEAEAMFETLVSWIRACGLFRYSREQDRFRASDALEYGQDGQA